MRPWFPCKSEGFAGATELAVLCAAGDTAHVVPQEAAGHSLNSATHMVFFGFWRVKKPLYGGIEPVSLIFRGDFFYLTLKFPFFPASFKKHKYSLKHLLLVGILYAFW